MIKGGSFLIGGICVSDMGAYASTNVLIKIAGHCLLCLSWSPCCASAGVSTCTPCPTGYYASTSGEVSVFDGFHVWYRSLYRSCTAAGATACAACSTSCPAGQYAVGCGWTSAGTCATCSCPAGKYLVGCGGTSAGVCSSCSPGTYSAVASNFDHIGCFG